MHEFKSALEAAFGTEPAGMAEVQVDQLDGRATQAAVPACYCRAEQPVMGSICRAEQPAMASICLAEQPVMGSICRVEQPVPAAG